MSVTLHPERAIIHGASEQVIDRPVENTFSTTGVRGANATATLVFYCDPLQGKERWTGALIGYGQQPAGAQASFKVRFSSPDRDPVVIEHTNADDVGDGLRRFTIPHDDQNHFPGNKRLRLDIEMKNPGIDEARFELKSLECCYQ